MNILANLSVLALRQAAEMAGVKEGADAVGSAIRLLAERFTDHSRKLDAALRMANDKAWKGLETALAGPTLLGRLSTSADDKAFSHQVGAFLATVPPAILPGSDPARFRKECLGQLKKARAANLLAQGSLDPTDLAQQAAKLAALGDSTRRLDAEWLRLDAIADALRGNYPTLASFLLLGRGKEPSILVTGVRYFFRRAIEKDDELFRGLAFTQMERLGDRQEQGFAALETLLDEQGQRLAGLLGDVLEAAEGARDAAEATLAELKLLRDEMAALRKEKGLQRQVRDGDSLTIRSDREKQRVREFLRRFRALPAAVQNSDPNVINDLGVLELAIGDHDTARQCFQQTAAVSPDARTKAEARYNAFRTLLEQDDRVNALAEMLAAAELDPERFCLFPTDRYEPLRILGRGGFGIAVLCRHSVTKRSLIIKAIRSDGLDFDPADVVAEAQALEDLDHRAIIRLRECHYADAAKRRPYLVMDYFDGPTLAEHVGQRGRILPDDFLPLARLIAEGLEHAHAHQILHRDAKPANLLVRKTGPTWEAKWIDFGLAVRNAGAAVAATHKPSSTPGSGDRAGTLDYAAPEQMGKGDGPVGPHSDVYGFGRVCYFALLGSPHPDDDDKDSLPEGWKNLLRGCTASKVAKRLPDFKTVLERLAEMPSAEREQKEKQDREKVRLQHEREQRERLQQEGERQLILFVRQAWDKSGGEKLTTEETKAAGELIRRHEVSTERAQEVVRAERRRWEADRPKGPRVGDIETVGLGNGVEMKFAWISPGTFMMGSPANEPEREGYDGADETLHRVTLTKGYWLGIHQVTQAQWQAVTGSNPSNCKGDNLPVENVSWNDCTEFVKKMGHKTGKRFRLPTEAEWEYACRAGTTTPFYFGETISTEQANYDGNYTYANGRKGVYRQKTTPVGSFPANAWGLYDMHGNVWEWCSDWYGAYPSGDIKDPQSGNSGVARVLRGGSWNDDPGGCRAAYRNGCVPDGRLGDFGCRVLLCLD